MQVTTRTIHYDPLPTNAWLPFEITAETPKPSLYDKRQIPDAEKDQVVSIEFSITQPGLERRKVWKNFGPYWPKEGKTTDFYELVQAVDGANCPPKGENGNYDTTQLVGKRGQLMMVDYQAKARDENWAILSGQFVAKQKIDRIIALPGTPAGVAPTAEPVTPTKKVKF